MTSPDIINTSDVTKTTDPDCELMLEALEMHLQTIKSRLLLITEQFSSSTHLTSTSPLKSPTVTPSSSKLVETSPKSKIPKYKSRNITPNLRSPTKLDSSTLIQSDNSTRKNIVIKRTPENIKYNSLSSLNTTATNTSTIRHAKTQQKNKPLSQIVEGWTQLHSYYKYLHQEMLEDHIKDQIKKQKTADLKWSHHCKLRDAKTLKIQLSMKPKMIRSELINDTSFLKKIEMSCFYKIVEAEHAMRKKGLIKTAFDIESFWTSMLSPRHTHLSKQRTPQSSKSADDIDQSREDDDTATDSWAITGLRWTEQIKENTTTTTTNTTTTTTTTTATATTTTTTTNNNNNNNTDPSIEIAIDANQMPLFHNLSDIIQLEDTKSSDKFNKFVINKRRQLEMNRDKLDKMLMRSRRNQFTSRVFIEMEGEMRINNMLDEFYEHLNKKIKPCQSNHVHDARERNFAVNTMNKLIVLPPAKFRKTRSYFRKYEYPHSPVVSIEDDTPEDVTSDHQQEQKLIPLSLNDLYSSQSLTVVESHIRSKVWRNTCL